jgi:murein DD-endopeptidase MepM/ murein hydrolase activator NlpD
LFEQLKPTVSWAKTHIVEPVKRFYPTRQVYFRANGKVRFVSLTPWMQMSATSVLAAFLLWTGVATFNYVFMDDILAEKDQELAARQRAFDALSSDMAQLEVDLQGTVKSVQAKQRYLETLLEEEAVELNAPAAETEEVDTPADKEANLTDPTETPYAVGGPEMPVDETSPVSATTDTGIDAEQSPWLDLKEWFHNLLSDDFGASDPERSARLKAIAGEVAEMRDEQTRITERMLELTDHRISRLSDAITTSGLQVDKVLAALDPLPQNAGGPLEELSDDERLLLESDDDDVFKALLASQDQLDDFDRVMQSFPVVKPLKDYYYISSSYGVRRDPFTKARALHGGLDMASHWKTPIYATAPGTVVKAGWNGAYGRMVEIDHGNGFKTRYGHTQTILVKKGQHIAKGERIALMGNSGRSTGTHLHYEVRFLDKPYNPVKFFKAEQHVLIKSDDS